MMVHFGLENLRAHIKSFPEGGQILILLASILHKKLPKRSQPGTVAFVAFLFEILQSLHSFYANVFVMGKCYGGQPVAQHYRQCHVLI